MMADRDSAYGANQIKDRTVTQLELDLTNPPSNAQFIQINMPDGDFTAVDIGSIGDITTMQTNIVLNAFRIAINGSLTQFNMVDGIVDEYEDENSIDNPNSTNESYDSVNDLYSPLKDSLDTSPFTHLKMENNTDDGTGANSFTNIGTPTFTAGHLNNAITLDGSSDGLNANAMLTDIVSDTTGSFAFWVKPDAGTNANVITFGDTNGQGLFGIQAQANDVSGDILIFINDASGSIMLIRTNGQVLTTTGYHHVVVTQDGIGITIYVDSVSVAFTDSFSNPTSWIANGNALDNGRIGLSNSNNGGNINFFAGQIDDFRYYSGKVLIQAEVDAIYNGGTGTQADKPEGDANNMTLISDVFTAEAQPDNARIVLFEEDVDSVTLNTDLKAFITRDAGQTFTTDFATDDKLDITSHGFSNDNRIMITSSSQDLPAGLDSATVYFVINVTTNDFELSLTSGGLAVELTDNGIGTHTAKQVSEITLANDGEYESGKNILTGSGDISGQPSGTSMEYNLITANEKDLKIHGTSLAWD